MPNFLEAGRTDSGKRVRYFVPFLHITIIWVIAQGCTDYVRPLDSFIHIPRMIARIKVSIIHTESLQTTKVSMIRGIG